MEHYHHGSLPQVCQVRDVQGRPKRFFQHIRLPVPAAPEYTERENLRLPVDLVYTSGYAHFPQVSVPPGHRFVSRNASAVASCQGTFHAQEALAGGIAQLQFWRLVRADARGQQHQPRAIP